MPASGARSGTLPSRTSRGAGTGAVGPTQLACGHETHLEYVVSTAKRERLYLCPRGCGLVKRATGATLERKEAAS